jgi:NMD protein affecting ribosome stability and mRNA decay
MINVNGLDVPSRGYVPRYFCKNCGSPYETHVAGKCLFEATSFVYETYEEIAQRRLADRYPYAPRTRWESEEQAAFLQQTVNDLRREGIPET